MVHISQIYPCSHVSLACELYYICELGKYLKFNYDESLSIDGVVLDKVLKKSELWDYFRIALSDGWVCNSGLEESEYEISFCNQVNWTEAPLKNVLFTLDSVSYNLEEDNMRREDAEYNLRVPSKATVSFNQMNDNYWLWTLYGEMNKGFLDNNKNLNSNLARQSWLSLVAFVAIERLKTGKPKKLLLQFCKNIVSNDCALSYIMLLGDETNCLTGWCFYSFDESVSKFDVLHQGYSAWYTKGLDMGYLQRWYSPKEKLAYMKQSDLRVGDVVWCYEREKKQQFNYMKSIAGCRLAIVREIKGTSITLFLCNTTKLYSQAEHDFNNHVMSVKKMFIDLPYTKFNSTVKTFDLNDMGVGYLMYTERYFIVPLDEAEDERITLVSRDGVDTERVNLPHIEFCYWLLKDYQVDFDADLYKEKYFPNSEPLYDSYMRGESLPPELYVIDDEDD